MQLSPLTQATLSKYLSCTIIYCSLSLNFSPFSQLLIAPQPTLLKQESGSAPLQVRIQRNKELAHSNTKKPAKEQETQSKLLQVLASLISRSRANLLPALNSTSRDTLPRKGKTQLLPAKSPSLKSQLLFFLFSSTCNTEGERKEKKKISNLSYIHYIVLSSVKYSKK